MDLFIYGCGKIGKRLLVELPSHSAAVLTKNAHPELSALLTQTDLILSETTTPPSVINAAIAKASCIIVTVTPHEGDYSVYTDVAARVVEHCRLDAQIIYTSSVGVYEGYSGNVDETLPLHPASNRSKILRDAESIYLSHAQSCVLRLGGIYGPGYSFIQYLQRVPVIAGPQSHPTNMIHASDVCSAIRFAKTNGLTGIYNLVDNDHPTRLELYTQLAAAKEIVLPPWDESIQAKHGGPYRVSNAKIHKAGFHFTYPERNILEFS